MVHPYTNQKLETFTISPIVHASMMYSIVLAELKNMSCSHTEHQVRSFFPEIITVLHTDSLSIRTRAYRSHLQSNKVTAVFILNSPQFIKFAVWYRRLGDLNDMKVLVNLQRSGIT